MKFEELKLAEINSDSDYILLVNRFAGIDIDKLVHLIEIRKWKMFIVFIDDVENGIRFVEIPKK